MPAVEKKSPQRAGRFGSDAVRTNAKPKSASRTPKPSRSPSSRQQVVEQSVPGIFVAVRVRPLLSWEQGSHDVVKVSPSGRGGSLFDIKEGRERTFEADIVFDSRPKAIPCSSQEVVFENLGIDLVKEALERYNVCLMAYGQSGSGKTHTLHGGVGTFTDGEAGLLPRMLRELFAVHAQAKTHTMRYQYCVSYYEVYNEQIFDLLAPSRIVKGEESGRSPEVSFHPKFGAVVSDLTECLVENAEGALGLLRFGNRARSVGSCTLNEHSPRSNVFFVLRFGIGVSRERPGSTITVVDLADCENANVGLADGLQEMGSLNHSLSHLSTCVANLVGRRGGEPRWPEFRKTKMTALLAHSLQGNSKTALVATISASSANYNESVKTIGFAELVSRIRTKLHSGGKNPDNLAKELRAEVQRLHQELSEPKCLGRQFLQIDLQEAEKMLNHCRRSWTDVEQESMRLSQVRNSTAASLGLATGAKAAELPGVPCLVNLSDDPALQACCVYVLRPGLTLRVGGDTLWSNVLLEGLGILSRMCLLVAADTERLMPVDAAGPIASLHIQSPSEVWVPQVHRSVSGGRNGSAPEGRACTLAAMQSGDSSVWPRVLVNGQRVQRVQDLWHNDRIIFGYSKAFRLVQPGHGEGISGLSLELNSALLQIQDEQSEQFQRMQPFLEYHNVEFSLNFVDLLHQVCSLVDEANLLTRQVRPSDNLMFQLQALPSLLDTEQDIPQLAVCMVQKPPTSTQFKCNLQSVIDVLYSKNGSRKHGPTGQLDRSFDNGTRSLGLMLSHQLHPLKEEVGTQEGASLICVWTVEKFLHRLKRMRDVYDKGAQTLNFAVVREELLEKPFEDPWNDVGVFEIQNFFDPFRMSSLSADTKGVPSTPASCMAHANVKQTYSSKSLTATQEGDGGAEENIVRHLREELEKAKAEAAELRRKCDAQAFATEAKFANEGTLAFKTSQPSASPNSAMSPAMTPGLTTPVASTPLHTPTRCLSPVPQRSSAIISVGTSNSTTQGRSVSPVPSHVPSVTSNCSAKAGVTRIHSDVVQAEVISAKQVDMDLPFQKAPTEPWGITPLPEYVLKQIASPQHKSRGVVDGRKQQYLGLQPMNRFVTPPPGRTPAQTPTKEVSCWNYVSASPVTQSPLNSRFNQIPGTPVGRQSLRR